MRSRKDLVDLINFIQSIHFEKAKPITLKQICFYLTPSRRNNSYRSFEIPKRSGGLRTISAPSNDLKKIQKCIDLILRCICEEHPNAYGFITARSIADNAMVHRGMCYVYNVDLKDFFPSNRQSRIWKRLQYPPFNLNTEKERLDLANIIATLCCYTPCPHESENEKFESVLPQGAPTSPVLTNIICERLDRKLTGLAKRFALNYSRYADDITFSSNHSVYGTNSEFKQELYRIIESEGFKINFEKERLQVKAFKQEVTGLIVNEKINVHKKWLKSVRAWIYLWETYGYEKAKNLYIKDYNRDRGYSNRKPAELQFVLWGKLRYLKMIKGENDPTYLKLSSRLSKLINGHPQKNTKKKIIAHLEEDVNTIIEMIMRHGIGGIYLKDE